MALKNLCFVFLSTFCFLHLPSRIAGKSMSINEYFPEIHREISRVTWAHAVNNHEKLRAALEDSTIMMLEADIVMGTHGHFEDIQPIMAHPPSKSSDLTFTQFLEAVLSATSESIGKRKGIKLDFKELDAVEPCLKHLNTRLSQPDTPSIPIFINADILQGPVNSTKKPINAERFLSLAKEHTPSAILSVGWTTRYGTDDPSDEIREGKYSKTQMKEMIKVLKSVAGDPPVFPHITFPVRAGLAAQSVEDLLYLTSRIRTDNSITLWSTKTDPVNRKALQSLVHQMTARHVFIDLPFSIDEDDQEDETDSVVIDAPGLSQIQHLEGRGHDEESLASGSTSSTYFSMNTILPVIAIGVITSAFIAYRRF